MQVQSLGQEDPLVEGMATYSSMFDAMDPEVWRATVQGVAKNRIHLKQHSTHATHAWYIY